MLSYPPASERRSVVIRTSVTPAEHAELVQVAQSRGRSIAEVVRTSLPLSANMRKSEVDRVAA